VWKFSPPKGFDPKTDQPLASPLRLHYISSLSYTNRYQVHSTTSSVSIPPQNVLEILLVVSELIRVNRRKDKFSTGPTHISKNIRFQPACYIVSCPSHIVRKMPVLWMSFQRWVLLCLIFYDVCPPRTCMFLLFRKTIYLCRLQHVLLANSNLLFGVHWSYTSELKVYTRVFKLTKWNRNHEPSAAISYNFKSAAFYHTLLLLSTRESVTVEQKILWSRRCKETTQWLFPVVFIGLAV